MEYNVSQCSLGVEHSLSKRKVGGSNPPIGCLFFAPCFVAQKKGGVAGYRSLCLTHAKRALYHLSYNPTVEKY